MLDVFKDQSWVPISRALEVLYGTQDRDRVGWGLSEIISLCSRDLIAACGHLDGPTSRIFLLSPLVWENMDFDSIQNILLPRAMQGPQLFLRGVASTPESDELFLRHVMNRIADNHVEPPTIRDVAVLWGDIRAWQDHTARPTPHLLCSPPPGAGPTAYGALWAPGAVPPACTEEIVSNARRSGSVLSLSLLENSPVEEGRPAIDSDANQWSQTHTDPLANLGGLAPEHTYHELAAIAQRDINDSDKIDKLHLRIDAIQKAEIKKGPGRKNRKTRYLAKLIFTDLLISKIDINDLRLNTIPQSSLIATYKYKSDTGEEEEVSDTSIRAGKAMAEKHYADYLVANSK